MSTLQVNPAFDPVDFLRNYWQQKPVLLKQLVPGFKDLITPAELAGLACEDFIESRLIRSIASNRWSIEHGPIAESTFLQMPDRDWTLLVQAVDQWMPELAPLKACFDFIPSWRIEDIMMSYATEAGGVGPHFDYYDVFLLQGSGQRRWQIGHKLGADARIDNQDGVGILPDFEAHEEFILNPGDALYIPPQYGHWGQSVGASTCYSIGFRAPALTDMLEGYSDSLISSSSPALRFKDALSLPPPDSARLDNESVRLAFEQVQSAINQPRAFLRWFGCYCTAPKYPEAIVSGSDELDREQLLSMLTQGAQLTHHAGSRFAYWLAEAQTVTGAEINTDLLLFVDGNVFEFPADYVAQISGLCQPGAVQSLNPGTAQLPEPLFQLVLELLNQGSLQLA